MYKFILHIVTDEKNKELSNSICRLICIHWLTFCCTWSVIDDSIQITDTRHDSIWTKIAIAFGYTHSIISFVLFIDRIEWINDKHRIAELESAFVELERQLPTVSERADKVFLSVMMCFYPLILIWKNEISELILLLSSWNHALVGSPSHLKRTSLVLLTKVLRINDCNLRSDETSLEQETDSSISLALPFDSGHLQNLFIWIRPYFASKLGISPSVLGKMARDERLKVFQVFEEKAFKDQNKQFWKKSPFIIFGALFIFEHLSVSTFLIHVSCDWTL